MRTVWLMVVALLVAPVVLQAQVRGPDRDRRAELEQQVRRRFMAQIAQRLELTQEQREQIRDVLGESADARTDLALESQALRIDLMQAARDEDASMDRFQEILDRFDAVRSREWEIQQEEIAALGEILTPKQQAMFLFMRIQFNDRIREMRGRGGPGGPGGAAALMHDGHTPFL